MKKLVLFFEYFDHEHLGKDPFMVPYYLGKALNFTVRIVYPLRNSNKNLPPLYKGVELCPYIIKDEKEVYRKMYQIIWETAFDIDVLMRFFDIGVSRKAAMIYKLRNPHGKVYIKMDINPYNINDKLPCFPKNILNSIKDFFYKSCVDVISCETQLAYIKLNESPNFYNHWGKKIVFMPNGFDEELLSSYHISEKNFTGKDNIMITVGRLGSPQKNTSMLLRALALVNFKDWKFYLIGPVDPSIKPEIDSFYRNNPDKKNSVVFTDAIYDKKELWEYYNRSKVFVLTSRWEGFALVYTEAQRFRNYIISTKVGAASDIIQDGKYGDFIEQEDSEGLAKKLEDIVNGKVNINLYTHFDTKHLSWVERLKVIANKLKS